MVFGKDIRDDDVTTLKDIEGRVQRDSIDNEQVIQAFKRKLGRRGFRKGRMRSKSGDEQKILDSFDRK